MHSFSLRKHWRLVAVGGLLDLLFLAWFVYLQVSVLVKVEPYLKNALQEMQISVQSAAAQQLSDVDSMLYSNPAFMNNYKVVLAGVGVVVALMFVAWILVQTISWLFVHRSFHSGIAWHALLGRSALAYVLLIVSVMASAMVYQNSLSFVPLISSYGAAVIAGLIFVAWHYLTSALMCSKSILSVFSVVSSKQFLLAFVVLVLIKVVLFFDARWFVDKNLWAGIAFIIIVLPFLMYSRLRLAGAVLKSVN